MATPPVRPCPAILHRQHEPLRRHLHFQGRTAGSTRRRRYHGRARGGAVPSHERLGGSRDREREVVFVDVAGSGKESVELDEPLFGEHMEPFLGAVAQSRHLSIHCRRNLHRHFQVRGERLGDAQIKCRSRQRYNRVHTRVNAQRLYSYSPSRTIAGLESYVQQSSYHPHDLLNMLQGVSSLESLQLQSHRMQNIHEDHGSYHPLMYIHLFVHFTQTVLSLQTPDLLHGHSNSGPQDRLATTRSSNAQI